MGRDRYLCLNSLVSLILQEEKVLRYRVNSITRYEQTLFAVHMKSILHNDRAEGNMIMKKTVTLLLILAMTLSFTACGGRQESSSQTENSLGS